MCSSKNGTTRSSAELNGSRSWWRSPAAIPSFPELRNRRKAKDRVVVWDSVVEPQSRRDLRLLVRNEGERQKRLRRGPGADEITAVRVSHIHEIPSSLILQPGPAALTEGVGLLHAILSQVAHGTPVEIARRSRSDMRFAIRIRL